MANKIRLSGSLLDLTFTSFVTVRIIRIIYVLAILLSLAGAVWFFDKSGQIVTVPDNTKADIARLGVAILFFFLSVLLSRILCEMLIVAFRIAENTGAMIEKLEMFRGSMNQLRENENHQIIQASRKCACGANIEGHSAFCTECGSKL